MSFRWESTGPDGQPLRPGRYVLHARSAAGSASLPVLVWGDR